MLMKSYTDLTFVICHTTNRKLSAEDDDSGRITIDLRGWNSQTEQPCAVETWGFPLADIEISAYYSEKFSSTYGDRLGLNIHQDTLTLADLERVGRPLRLLHKKLDTIEAKYGHATSVGQLMAYVAAAMGITQFARPNARRHSGWQHTTSVADAIQWCDAPIAQFHAEHADRRAVT
jgi:hypothetical protein